MTVRPLIRYRSLEYVDAGGLRRRKDVRLGEPLLHDLRQVQCRSHIRFS